MIEINTVFKKKKPRQFNYLPRYYDPDQEERDFRSAMSSDKQTKEYVPGSLVKAVRMERYKQTDNTMNRNRVTKEARTRVLLRLIIFLFLLFMVGYIIMNSTILEQMFMVFSK
ncbi:MAG: hypothetical protein RR550_01885 [Rikenellaceae bacterium]